MARWNPLSKSYHIKCGNGSIKTIYKKADDAFPLFISGYEGNISAKVNSELLKESELTANTKSKVDTLLYGLDDINNGLMMSFRSAYIGYQTDPCANNGFLLDQITKINEEQRRLRALKMQIVGYVELAKSNPGDSTKLAELYSDLVNKIGSTSMGDAGVIEAISISRDAAHKFMKSNHTSMEDTSVVEAVNISKDAGHELMESN
jgi:hypothetical protein